jgi:hypothetical protein
MDEKVHFMICNLTTTSNKGNAEHKAGAVIIVMLTKMDIWYDAI